MSDARRDVLDNWAETQEPRSRDTLRACVSAEGFRHERPEFGQTVIAAPGSVLASRHRARWAPAPDYAYHWVRDAAVVMRLARSLARREPESWRRRMEEHAAFSLRIATRSGPAANPLAATAMPAFRRFLRSDGELARLRGDALFGEPRANPDGSVDCERWSRPQHDGPALRALSLMAWDRPTPALRELLALDLGYTLRHAAHPCIGPWEEADEVDLHAFTLLAQRAALAIALGRGLVAEPAGQAALRSVDAALADLVEPESGIIRARRGGGSGATDAAVVLGALLHGAGNEPFGPADPLVLATAARLADWSAGAFAINREGAPAIGRNAADRFFGGNPWLPTTLGMAELHFVLAVRILATGPLPRSPAAASFLAPVLADDPAARAGDRAAAARALVTGGERYLETVRRLQPADATLPEQVDRETGAPTSCPDLTWSHAALIAALDARQRARQLLAGEG